MTIFENDIDKSNEAKVAGFVANHLGIELRPMPKFSSGDYVSIDGKTLLEIRCRSHNLGKYSETVLPMKKLEQLLLYGEKEKARVYYCVAFLDKIGLTELEPDGYFLKPFYRIQSRGNSNLFIAAYIPIEEFEVIGDSIQLELKKSCNWVNQLA